MEAKRLGRTKSQLAEHQLEIKSTTNEEAQWLQDIIEEYWSGGKELYIVAFNKKGFIISYRKRVGG